VTAAASVVSGAPITVPYITQWSEEQTSSVPVVHRRRGIAYADERPGDRDEHGVLWIRESSRPRQGAAMGQDSLQAPAAGHDQVAVSSLRQALRPQR
jgi:hypothetical protein